jgi:hypothetical protein
VPPVPIVVLIALPPDDTLAVPPLGGMFVAM